MIERTAQRLDKDAHDADKIKARRAIALARSLRAYVRKWGDSEESDSYAIPSSSNFEKLDIHNMPDYHLPNFDIYPSQHATLVHGEKVKLTKGEFTLLTLIAKSENCI